MKLSKSLDQAICIITLLATQDTKEPLAVDIISKKLNISHSYTQKITRKLSIAGIINSVSGKNGGISLAKELKEITMLHVINAVEGELSIYPDSGLIRNSFEGSEHVKKGEELLMNVFNQADKILNDYFSNITAEHLFNESFENNIPVLNWKNTLH